MATLKKEVIQRVSKKLGKSNKEIEKIVRAFFMELPETLSANKSLMLRGCGTFSVRATEEHIKKIAGKDTLVPKQERILFKAGKNLIKIINQKV